MRIGHLAAAAGLTPATIRYYEVQGLLPAPERGDQGYRIYTEMHLERLRFIRHARALGLSIKEIHSTFHNPEGTCSEVRDLLAEKHRAVSVLTRWLLEVQGELGRILAQPIDKPVCDVPPGGGCFLIRESTYEGPPLPLSIEHALTMGDEVHC